MADPTQISSLPEPKSLIDQIGAEQVAALFRNVTLGVCGAAAGSIILSVILVRIGGAEARIASAWSGLVTTCAVAHILLGSAYDRARTKTTNWQSWGKFFAVIALAEGICWGWAPVGLVTAGGFEMVLLVLVVTFAIAAGAIPAFSPYLPAFLALFLPATTPYAIVSISSASSVQQASVLLAVVFIGAMGALGIGANRTFRDNVRLRLETEQMAEELRRQKDIAEQASLAKSTFLAAASHDLRQPVHALGLFVGALRAVDMGAEGRGLVQQIESSVAAMDGLFSALLDISRLDAGIVEVHRRPFAIAPFLERICRDYVQDAKTKDLTLVWKKCSAVADTDPVLLERIVRNLVSNAVRYTQNGRIVVGCRRRRAHIAIQVWDTGPGIPPDQHERIFQEYYQIGNTERDRAKGLGLGLAIVQRLTRLLDCPMRLVSRLGHGSCFEVTVPRAIQSGVDAQEAVDVGSLATGFVLVIDDELAIREAMASLLGGWGHEVITAGSGEEALERLSSCPDRPDLIISDLRLRDNENGIDVVDRLRSEFNEIIPAMLITGDTAPGRLVEARDSGLLLLHKPVPNSKLRATIAHLLRATYPDTTGEDAENRTS